MNLKNDLDRMDNPMYQGETHTYVHITYIHVVERQMG